jgi:hypothetical protein
MRTFGGTSVPKGGCFATSVRKASRRLTQLYGDALAPNGLRPMQYCILAELAARSDSPTLSELAEVNGAGQIVTRPYTSAFVRDGYVALRIGAQMGRLDEPRRHKFREAFRHRRTAQEGSVSHYGAKWSEGLRVIVPTIAHDDPLGNLAECAA